MKPVIKGLCSSSHCDGFISVEMERGNRSFSMVNYALHGQKIWQIPLPIAESRKTVVSGNGKIAGVLTHEMLIAISLATASSHVVPVDSGGDIFWLESEIAASLASGGLILVDESLTEHRENLALCVVAMSRDRLSTVYRLADANLLVRHRTGEVILKPTGTHVLSATFNDGLLWLAESGGVLRVLDLERLSLTRTIRLDHGWHFISLAPTLKRHEVFGQAVNYETGCHSQFWLMSECHSVLKGELPIAPVHGAFFKGATRFVSGTREVFDTSSMSLAYCF